ncbi:MAG: M20 family metallopeptidase [Chloroflexi bacterium]|nr:M20 family metallopeptidase [Chloroflexota bacterium]
MMVSAQSMKERVSAEVDRLARELVKASDYLAAHPEIGYQEYESSALLRNTLDRHGIRSEAGTAGMPTAFRAELPGQSARPRIALLAEYDALPGIGHGCGHNIIATSTIGAAIALRSVMKELPGSVVLLGTPCEESTAEGAGGKIPMVSQGLFDQVDAAIMMHPGTLNMVSTASSLAARGFDFEFFGRAAHAAAKPHEGINALDAVIQTYNGVNALRQHLRPDVRIHGIITNGGAAANVVPEYASCRFRVRSESVSYLEEVVQKVIHCAEGAALMAGATFKWTEYANPYHNYIANEALARLGRAALREAGVKLDEVPEERGMGSTDFGNVSHKTPCVTLRLSIGDLSLRSHSAEFAAATLTPRGHQSIIDAAKAMAFMAVELIANPALLQEAHKEWEAAMAAQA